MNNDDLQLALEKRLHTLETILDFSRSLNAAKNLKSISDITLLSCMGHKSIEVTSLLLDENLDDAFTIQSIKGGASPPKRDPIHFPASVMESLHKKPYLYYDPQFFTDAPQAKQSLDEISCSLLLPIVHQDDLIGVLSCSRKIIAKDYTKEDIEFLQLVASHAGIAISNILALKDLENSNKQLEKRLFELQAVEEINHSLSSSLDLKGVCHTLLLTVTGYLTAGSGVFYFYNADVPKQFQLVSHMGLETPGIKKTIQVSARCQKELKQHQIVPKNNDYLSSPFPKLFKDLHMEVCIPILFSNTLLGLVFFGEKATGLPYKEEQLKLAGVLVRQAIAPLRNSQFYLQLKEYNLLLEKKVEERTQALQQANAQLTQAHQRMAQELEDAETLQKTMIPDSLPKLRELELNYFFQAATETGGDWFTYLVQKDHLFILMGDVTGHGMPAALVVASVYSTWLQLQNFAKISPDFQLSPKGIMEQMNYTVYKTGRQNYLMTLFVARIDLKTGEILFSNAGHNFPILYHHDGSYQELLVVGNRLGWDLKTSYTEKALFLKKEDLLFFYTDGLIENMNPDEKAYELHQLRKFLKSHQDNSVDALVSKLSKDCFNFYDSQPLEDDVSFLALKILDDFQEAPKEN